MVVMGRWFLFRGCCQGRFNCMLKSLSWMLLIYKSCIRMYEASEWDPWWKDNVPGRCSIGCSSLQSLNIIKYWRELQKAMVYIDLYYGRLNYWSEVKIKVTDSELLSYMLRGYCNCLASFWSAKHCYNYLCVCVTGIWPSCNSQDTFFCHRPLTCYKSHCGILQRRFRGQPSRCSCRRLPPGRTSWVVWSTSWCTPCCATWRT